MAKLGTKEHPAVVRVRTELKAQEILALCQEHGYTVIVGLEEDKPEDISDVKKLIPTVKSTNLPQTISLPKIGRNAPCICGSGLKYKKCCGKNNS